MSLPALNPALRYPVILFDLGSTLIYFDGSWEDIRRESNRALLVALLAEGINLQGDSFDQAFERRLEAYYAPGNTEFIEYTLTFILGELLAESGYPNTDQGLLQRAILAWNQVGEVHWKAEAETLPTLGQLRSLGYRLGIISNTGFDASVQHLVDQNRLRPYFDVILTSAAQGIRKPNPLIFHTALSHWGAQPSQAVMVGDTLGADILGAHNAGLHAVWITRRADAAANRAHADTILPDAAIEKLSDLPALLSRL